MKKVGSEKELFDAMESECQEIKLVGFLKWKYKAYFLIENLYSKMKGNLIEEMPLWKKIFILLAASVLFQNSYGMPVYITHYFDLEIDAKIVGYVFVALVGLFVFLLLFCLFYMIIRCHEDNRVKINTYGYKIKKNNCKVFVIKK